MRKLGRMVRWVLTAVSLLLFAAVLAAWVRGYWYHEGITVRHYSSKVFTRVGVRSGGGELGFICCRGPIPNGMEEFFRNTMGEDQIAIRSFRGSSERVSESFATFQIDLGHPYAYEMKWQRYGIFLARYRGTFGFRDHLLAFPCWMAAIAFGALPSWRACVWWRGVRRRRLAARAGRCEVCGYDLRASPLRCPECGLVVEEGHEGEKREAEERSQ